MSPWLPGACQQLCFTAATCSLRAVQTAWIVTNLLLPSCGSGCSREESSGSRALPDISEISTEPSNLQGPWVNITRGLGGPFRLWGAACTAHTPSAAGRATGGGGEGKSSVKFLRLFFCLLRCFCGLSVKPYFM